MTSTADLRKQVVALAQRRGVNFVELALTLVTLHDVDVSQLRELPKETGMSRRRLYYLLDVGRFLNEHPLAKPDAEAIGWTKLQIIAHHLSNRGKNNIEGANSLQDIMNIAKATSAGSLSKALTSKRVLRSRAVQFRLSDAARSELNDALLVFGAKQGPRGLANKESALIDIVRAAKATRETAG